MATDADTYVLTLKLDAASFARLDALRQRHFPRERNFLPAHLTLLHTASAAQVGRLTADSSWARRVPIALRFTALRSLGGGSAFAVESPDLMILRAHVITAMAGVLTRQDSQSFRPHVTIQNKVPPLVAADLFAQLSASFEPWEGEGTGLLIWRYCGGPWELAAEFAFAAPACHPPWAARSRCFRTAE